MFLENKKEGEVTTEEWRTMFVAAADYIRKNGHCKKVAFDGNKACFFGALWIVSDAKEIYFTTLLPKGMKYFSGTPIEWNDAPERTAEEVVAKLEEIAAS